MSASCLDAGGVESRWVWMRPLCRLGEALLALCVTFWEGLHVTWNSLIWLDWLTNELMGSTCLHPLSTEINGTKCSTQLFMWELGVSTLYVCQVSYFPILRRAFPGPVLWGIHAGDENNSDPRCQWSCTGQTAPVSVFFFHHMSASLGLTLLTVTPNAIRLRVRPTQCDSNNCTRKTVS